MSKILDYNKTISKILIYIFCFWQIILVNESAYTLYVFKPHKSALYFDIVLAIYVFYKLIIKKTPILKKMFLILIIFIFFVLNSMLLNNDFNSENFLVVNAIINGFLIASIFDTKTYLITFKNCILFFCIYGLIVTYVLLPMKMTTLFVTYYNPLTHIPYYNAGFSFVMGWNGLMRLQGIFREPGVFQIYILLSAMIEIFIDNKKIINIVIFMLSMIMTFSTSLLVSLIPFLLALLLRKDKLKSRYIFPLVIILLFVFFNSDVHNYILKSLSKLTVGSTESTDVRYNSIKYLLGASLSSPLFGKSYVNGYFYIRYHYLLPLNCDITGTFITNIMAGGYIYGLTIIYLFYQLINIFFCKKKYIISILLFTSLFLSICSQNMVYSSIIWTLVFFGLKSKAIEREANNEK